MTMSETRTRLPVEEILSLATRAPSIQNSQPWLWRQSELQLDLYADLSRQLAHADPSGRDLILSCGAALHHVQVAAEGLGWHPRISRMPHPGDPHHLATITFEPCAGTPEAYDAMRAITSRRTDRHPMTDWSVPRARLTELAEEGARWGALVTITDGGTARRLHDLAATAHQSQQARRYYQEEEAAAERPRPGPRPLAEGEQVLLIATAGDDELSWLRAGEALSAIWLRAELGGLAVVPMSQAVEVDDTYRVVRDDVLQGRSCPQVLIRVGFLHEDREPEPPTSRRPIDEVLVRRPPSSAVPWPRAGHTGPEWRGKSL